MTKALRVHGLHYRYPDGLHALKGVDLCVEEGECLALVGPNSAGKSTLLLHCNGCLLPAEGEVRVAGVPVDKAHLDDIRRRVGTVFQEADDQLFMPTIAEDVGFGPHNMGLAPQEVQARVEQALAAVGAGHLLQRQPHHLSGGEKRAVAIATVLAMRPGLLLLDEPTSNLDPRARRRFMELARSLPQTRIIATHDMDMVLELCARTVVLYDGQVRADGPTREIFQDAILLQQCGLEVPLCIRGLSQ